MVAMGVANEEGQTVQYLDCPECGHQLKEPAGGASSLPSGW
jgi:ribosomal protein S27E